MSQDMPSSAPSPAPAEPQKKSNTALIVGGIAVVLCCCCLAFVVVGWQYGDQILKSLGLQ